MYTASNSVLAGKTSLPAIKPGRESFVCDSFIAHTARPKDGHASHKRLQFLGIKAHT